MYLQKNNNPQIQMIFGRYKTLCWNKWYGGLKEKKFFLATEKFSEIKLGQCCAEPTICSFKLIVELNRDLLSSAQHYLIMVAYKLQFMITNLGH